MYQARTTEHQNVMRPGQRRARHSSAPRELSSFAGRALGRASLFVLAACGRFGFDPLPAPAPAADAAMPDSALAPCAPSAELAACYAFENDLADSSGNHNDASTVSGATYVPGMNGLAVQLDATADVRAPHSATLDATNVVTYEAWVRLDVDATGSGRAMILDHNSQFAAFFRPGAIFTCALSTAATDQIVPGSAIALGVWTHVACTYDGAMLRAWVAGVDVADGPLTGAVNLTTDGIRLGGNWPDVMYPNDDRLIGALDQLRIWHSVRTAQELCAAAGSC